MSFQPTGPLTGNHVIGVPNSSFYRDHFKRAVDIVAVLFLAPIALAVLLPFVILVSLDGTSPLYWQKRIGKNGRIFHMLKLRSMVRNADKLLEKHLAENAAARVEWNVLQKLKTDPRITPIGKVIRKTSLDELPQLWNVLTGDMSLVGPRPIMCDQQEIYPGSAYYHMRPGITGLWQISDRNECSFAERAVFDTRYYNDISFKSDFSVLTRTVGVVLRATGH